jgi:hypothetical protein
MKLTFNPAAPIVSEQTNAEYADAFVELVEKVVASSSSSSSGNFLSNLNISEGSLSLAAPAWSEFFTNLSIMKENVADPKDFYDAFNFWVFFAVGHPLLQPILWISDVLQ